MHKEAPFCMGGITFLLAAVTGYASGVLALPVAKATLTHGQSEWRRETGSPSTGQSWQREMGRALERTEGHSRQTDRQIPNSTCPQHSVQLWVLVSR